MEIDIKSPKCEEWKTLKKELEVEFFNYQTGLFPQDMDTTIRVGERIRVLRKILDRMDELEKSNCLLDEEV